MYNSYNFSGYQNYQMPTAYQQYGQLNQLQQPQQSPQTYLNGKVVDSIDVVKVMDVPIGGYGFYPKADLSEVYIKSWNPNGTTSITTYKIKEEEVNNVQEKLLSEEKIIARIDALESRIASLVAPQPVPVKKEELNINDAF